MAVETFDLGHGYSFEFTRWAPDRDIPTNAEKFAGIPDIDPCGIILHCPHGSGSILFALFGMATVFGQSCPLWELHSWKPLHIEPSILRHECGCHGFIRDGKWVPA